MTTNLPNIPTTPVLADPALKSWMNAVREIIEVFRGQRGNELDRVLTLGDISGQYRDLLGLYRSQNDIDFDYYISNQPSFSNPNGTIGTPTAVTNFEVVGGFSNIFLSWDLPAYVGHSHCKIYRSETNDYSTRLFIATAAGVIFADAVDVNKLATIEDPSIIYYYWITAVNILGVEGPVNKSAGTPGEAAVDPAYMLELISGQIKATDLYTDLRSRIDLIDTSGTGILDRIATIESEMDSLAEFTDKTYELNDIVIYESKIYICTQAITETPAPLPTDTDYWEKVGESSSLAGDVSANATAIGFLDTRVETNEGLVGAHAQALTTINTRLDDETTGITATASAISQMTTDISDNTGDISDNANILSGVAVTVNNESTGVNATAAALSELEAEITGGGGLIEASVTDAVEISKEYTEGWSAQGATSDLTLKTTGDVVAIGNTITKPTGGYSWGAGQAYSVESYVGSCRLSFRPTQTNKAYMIGLNNDNPPDDALTEVHYGSINYAWYPSSSGIANIYESQSSKGSYGTYTADSLFEIIYDGATVKYYLDGDLKRDRTAIPDLRLYVDSDIQAEGAVINSITFGPYHRPDAVTDTAIASAVTTLNTTIDTNKQGTDATATSLTTLTGRVGTAEGLISTNNTAIVESGGLIDLSASETLQASIDHTEGWSAEGATVNRSDAATNDVVTAAVEVEAGLRIEETGDLFAKYTVKVDDGDRVSGFGLASEPNEAGGQTSSFIVNSDYFGIDHPNNTEDEVIPFSVVDGKVYIQSALIENGTITSAKIGSGVFDEVYAQVANIATINASEIIVGATNQYVNDQSSLLPNHNFEMVDSDNAPLGLKHVYIPKASNGAGVYDTNLKALHLNNPYIISAFPAIKIDSNLTYKIELTAWAPVTSSGFYFRANELDGDLPENITHVGYNNSPTEGCVICTREILIFNNLQLTPTHQLLTAEYTPTSTARWVSFTIWRWEGSDQYVQRVVINLNLNPTTTLNANQQWNDVSGSGIPADDATNDADLRHTSDLTTINGGKIFAGSEITVGEGGKMVVGDKNIIIDSADVGGSQGRIIIAPDGGPDTNDYCEITDAKLTYNYYNGATHTQYNAIRRFEVVEGATSGQYTAIPGLWRVIPRVVASLASVGVYEVAYKEFSQSVRCYVEDIRLQSGKTTEYEAKPILELNIAGGVVPAATPVDKIANPNTTSAFNYYTAATVLQADLDISKITISVGVLVEYQRTDTWYHDGDVYYSTSHFPIPVTIYLQGLIGGSWASLANATQDATGVITHNMTGGSVSSITQYRVRVYKSSSDYCNTVHITTNSAMVTADDMVALSSGDVTLTAIGE